MTDITDTVLVSCLIKSIEEGIANLRSDVKAFTEFLIDNPGYYAGSSRMDELFETSAKIKVREAILAHYRDVLEKHDSDVPLRCTLADVTSLGMYIIRHYDPTARSSSTAHNIMEAHVVRQGLRLAQGDAYGFSEFRHAQRNDEVVQAECSRRYEVKRAYDAMRAEADADNKAFDRKARRAARRA